MNHKGQDAADVTVKIVISVLASSVAVVVVSQSFISTVSSQTGQNEKAWLKENIEKPAREMCTGSNDPYPSESEFVERDIQFSDFSAKESETTAINSIPRHTLEVLGSGGNIKHELFVIRDSCSINVDDNTDSSGGIKKFRVEREGNDRTDPDVRILIEEGGS